MKKVTIELELDEAQALSSWAKASWELLPVNQTAESGVNSLVEQIEKQVRPMIERLRKTEEQARGFNLERCHFCTGKWGFCVCPKVNLPPHGDQGFLYGGHYITLPHLDETERFYVNPTKYYGEAYVEWKYRETYERLMKQMAEKRKA